MPRARLTPEQRRFLDDLLYPDHEDRSTESESRDSIKKVHPTVPSAEAPTEASSGEGHRPESWIERLIRRLFN